MMLGTMSIPIVLTTTVLSDTEKAIKYLKGLKKMVLVNSP